MASSARTAAARATGTLSSALPPACGRSKMERSKNGSRLKGSCDPRAFILIEQDPEGETNLVLPRNLREVLSNLINGE